MKRWLSGGSEIGYSPSLGLRHGGGFLTVLSFKALGKDTFNFGLELRDGETNAPQDQQLIGAAGSFHLPEVGTYIDR